MSHPSEKWWSLSVGIPIPNLWKNKKCSKSPTRMINHPPVITINRWDWNHSQSWLVYDIVLPTLQPIWNHSMEVLNLKGMGMGLLTIRNRPSVSIICTLDNGGSLTKLGPYTVNILPRHAVWSIAQCVISIWLWFPIDGTVPTPTWWAEYNGILGMEVTVETCWNHELHPKTIQGILRL